MVDDRTQRYTLRLPERPTMPCPVCLGHGRRWRNGQPDGVQCSCVTGSIPIPEGTRVEVGWWDVPDDRSEPIDWYPVATATVDEVRDESCINPNDCCGYCPESWNVTLTDVRSTDG